MKCLVHPDEVDTWETIEVPVLVIGGGVAGLSAAIEVAEHTDVLLITKAWLSDSNTDAAQGGVAAVLSHEDSFESHVNDTMAVGCGVCHREVVENVVRGGPEAIARLIEWGGHFDERERGRLALGLEGGHSAGRVVHAQGDQTGREIQRVLMDRSRGSSRLKIMEHTFALDLLCQGNRVVGVQAFCSGRYLRIFANAVIVAAGGCGRLYRETTNRAVATGDGHAMMYRGGVQLRGMELVQFHPTTLYVAGASRVLISEAVRGEGGILRDLNGVSFMDELHDQASLAPRDIVSRAVLDRMVSTGHTHVFLDVRHLPPGFVRERFPRIHRVCQSFGLDISKDQIPVAPAAHYMIGGAAAGVDGHTSMTGLWAVGEASSTGLHGANRLASNSLLEGLVLGMAAGKSVLRSEPQKARVRAFDTDRAIARRDWPEFNAADLSNSLKSLMWRQVGIRRDGAHLADATQRLQRWLEMTAQLKERSTNHWELLNQLQVAGVIAVAARERNETRGVHFRTDFPEPNDRRWRADLLLRRTPEGSLELERSAVANPAAPRSAPKRWKSPGSTSSKEGVE